MKKQALVALAVLFTLTTMIGTAFAWQEDGYGRKGCMGKNKGDAQQWDKLSDDQKTQLQELHRKFTDESASDRASIVAKKNQIRILMESSQPDQAKLQSLVNEISDIKKGLMNKKIQMAVDAKKISPDLNIPMESMGMKMFKCMGMDCGEDCCPRSKKCRGMMSKMGKNHGKMNMSQTGQGQGQGQGQGYHQKFKNQGDAATNSANNAEDDH
ncbi:MAG: periplasmic heavy metal sensor [Desulfamplus sp.]|nr:periplasmic heavy metal sensor [Desulfamplus sp.]